MFFVISGHFMPIYNFRLNKRQRSFHLFESRCLAIYNM